MKNIFFLFYINCSEAVLTSTHNLCFKAKIRKVGIPLQTPVFFYITVGFKEVYLSWTRFPDVINLNNTVQTLTLYLTSS